MLLGTKTTEVGTVPWSEILYTDDDAVSVYTTITIHKEPPWNIVESLQNSENSSIAIHPGGAPIPHVLLICERVAHAMVGEHEPSPVRAPIIEA